jgi:hypothetical protein
MAASMTEDQSKNYDLLRRAQAGDERALADVFTGYRGRLKRLVQLRLVPAARERRPVTTTSAQEGFRSGVALGP